MSRTQIWITGTPNPKFVAEHERDFPGPITRTDGIRLGRITVSHEERPGGDYVRVDNEESYGNWICINRYSSFGPVPSFLRLRVVDDEVLMAVGFTSWMPLLETKWAARALFFPVGANGLPTDYERLDPDVQSDYHGGGNASRTA